MTSKITLNATGLTTAAPDSYVWLNPYGGAWGTAGNWTDSTTGTTATAAPGAANAVSIAGGTIDFINITGSGAAASLAVANMVLLWGTVSVGGAVALAGNSDLELDGAAKLTAGSLTFASNYSYTNGQSGGTSLLVGNASTLKVSGAATLGAGSTLLAMGGSTVQLGSLVANGAGLYNPSGSLVAVDDNSAIEVGTAGGAALGAITIDKGQVAVISGTLDGNVVVNGSLEVQAGDGLIIDGYALSYTTDPFGNATTISGAGTVVLSENSSVNLGVADSAAVQFAGPNGLLALNVLSTGTIGGFTNGDSIELYGLATGMSVALTGTTLATLTFTKGGKAAGTLKLAGNYTGSQFHMSMDRSGDGFVTVQTVGSPRTQPALILGTVGSDHLTATANKQSLTGLGGNDTLDGGGFTGVVFKDTSADLNGSTIQNGSTSDTIDLTDMTLSKVSINYTAGYYNPATYQFVPGTLTASDGTHTATLQFTSTLLPTGYFASGPDGATGTDLKFVVIQTVATANNQTLTGLGIAGTLDAGTFTGIDFKDTSAHLNGVTLNNFGTTDLIDLTDMTLGKASVSYVAGHYDYTLQKYINSTLTVGDGTHAATVMLTANLPLGVFQPAGDGGTGTDLTYKAAYTTATANNQTLYGLGVVTYLDAGVYSGIDFKDSSADLNGVTLNNFAATDLIDLNDMSLSKVSVSYVPAYYNSTLGMYLPNTLTVADGTHSATMTLYTSVSLALGYFAASGDGAAGTKLTYTVVNPDALTFNAPLGGSYATAGNWQDTTTSAVAAAAPSYGNAVTIAQLGAGYTNVGGSGAAASLTTSGDVLLRGSLTVGARVGGVSGALAQSGSLELDGGASLSLTGTASVSGLLEVGGGSKLTAGALLFGPTGSGALLAVGGSTVQVGNLVGYQQYIYYSPSFYPSTVGIDATSVFEIGTAGGAAKGALTVDSGITAELFGTLDGNVVLGGTLLGSGLTIAGFGGATGAITGAGTLEIVSGGTLTLAASDSAAIYFSHGSGYFDTLVLNGALPTGSIGGFGVGDAITVAKTVTRVSYSQTGTAPGILSLFNGATSVGTLSLVGTYTAAQFQVGTSPGSAVSTITYSPAPGTAPGTQISSNSDTFYWANGSGGVWSNAGNWTDNSVTAASAPGAGNNVYIDNGQSGSSVQIIAGSGSAASLNLSSGTAITGSITVGGGLTTNADVYIETGASITATSLTTYGGTLRVAGGSLTISGTSAGTAYLSGANWIVTGGGGMQVVGQGGTSTIYGSVAVDGTSHLEFGAAGSATKGALTVDAGMAVNLYYGGTIDANVVLNGTLNVSYGGTVQGFGGAAGSISGSGTIALSFGTLVLNATDGTTIAMPSDVYGQPGTLDLMGALPTGTIDGFATMLYYYQTSNVIAFNQHVTGASFVQTTASLGTLTLTNGAATVGTLKLAGSFTGDLFHLDVAPGTGVASLSLQTAPGAAGTSPVSTGKDAFAWTGAATGVWSTASFWTDSTTSTAATTVPGSGNAVSIAGAINIGVYSTIGGNGAAASLALTGNVLLTGTVAVGQQLSLAPINAAAARLSLDGGKLTAGSARIGGTLQVEHAGSVAVAGMATMTGGTLLALGGSTVQVGGLIANNSNDVIAIDANSAIKIGSPAAPVVGGLTQQAGTTAVLTGAIYGSVAANGTLSVAAGGGLLIDMTGTAKADPYSATPVIGGVGVLSLNEGSTLGLGVAATTTTIQFNGPNATLQLAAMPTSSITGFAAGDTIVVDKTVTGLIYKQTTATAATLTLTNGGAAVGTLNLAGNFASAGNFHLDVAASGATATISLQTIGAAAAQPTLITGTAATDLLYATANSQTLTGLGGGDTFNGETFTGLDFKDLTANLTGSAIQDFATTDLIDFTDMNAAKASVTYSNGILSASDGTHAATLSLGFLTTPATGSFTFASDGASGTKVYWH